MYGPAPDIRLFLYLDNAVRWFLWRTYLARYHLQLAAWTFYITCITCVDINRPIMFLVNALLLAFMFWGTINFSGALQKLADDRNMAIPVAEALSMIGFIIRMFMLCVSVTFPFVYREHLWLGIGVGVSFYASMLLGFCTTWPRRKPEPKEKRVPLKLAYDVG